MSCIWKEVGLETPPPPPKRIETKEKASANLNFKYREDMEKVQEQGRVERMQEDYPTME